MTRTYYSYEPDYIVTPGDLLADVLRSRGIRQTELAEKLDVSTKHLNRIIKGKAPVSQKTAIGLERVLDIPASFWLNAESRYRIHAHREDENLAQHRGILSRKPIRELIRRGHIPADGPEADRVEAVLKFFGEASVAGLLAFWDAGQAGREAKAIALRRSRTITGDPVALATWLRIGHHAAMACSCEAYDKAKFMAALRRIRTFTLEPTTKFITDMKELCASAGVVFSMVKEISGAAVSGATQWVSPDKATIMLNLYGKRNDRFWFTFFHEAGHILQGRRETYIEDITQTDCDEEKQADQFAADFLIPPKFRPQLPSLRASAKIEQFAAEIGIHPGIVVGRLQHEKILRMDRHNDMKVKFDWK